MSDLCLNYNLKEIENMTNILYHVFRVHNDKVYAIHGWGKKIIGYGIKQTSFDNFNSKQHPINERKFRIHRQTLLDNRLIEVFDKSKRVKGGPYYSITPLGLLFLLTKIKKYEKNMITDIFKVLDFTRLRNQKMRFDVKLWKYFTPIQINKAMKQLTHQTEFTRSNDKFGLSLDLYLFSSMNRIRIFQSKYDSKIITLEKALWKQYEEEKDSGEIVNVDKKEFYWQVSFYFTLSLCYYLFKNLKSKAVIQKTPLPFREFVDMIYQMIHDELSGDSINISHEIILASVS